MLQRFRDNLKGTVATILVGLIIIPFALFGVDSLFLQNGSANEAAEVNGEVITELELRQGIFLQKQQMLSRFGENLPAQLLTDERLREPVLNNLIQRRILVQEAKQGGMAISDETLNQLILSAEQFQQDGKFDRQRYQQLLRSMNYTAVGYKQLLERDMLLNQHASGFSGTGFVTEAELQTAVALAQQKRRFYYLTLPLDTTENSQTVSDEEISAYYQENLANYLAPEQVAIEYIDTSAKQLVEGLEFSEEQLRQQYQQNLANFEPSVERRAAHILIESKGDGSETAVAETVLSRLAAGDDFTALAKEFSEDLSSRDQGGDLGFTAGDIFPEAFEEALAALNVGETSGVVETDAGLHIIKLLEEQGAEAPTFEQQRASIEQSLKEQEAESLFVELLENLSDLAYNAGNLTEVAQELGLKVSQSDLFDRSGGEGLLGEPDVLAAAFSDEVMVEGNTSEVIELSDSRVVVLRVIEHQPEHTKPLETVRAEIVDAVKRDKAKVALAEKAADVEAQLRAGEDVEALAKANGLEWQVTLGSERTDPKVNSEILSHVFSLAKPDGKPRVSGFHLSNGDYVVVSLTHVEPGLIGDLSTEQKRAFANSLARQSGMADYVAYEAHLKAQADIDVR